MGTSDTFTLHAPSPYSFHGQMDSSAGFNMRPVTQAAPCADRSLPRDHPHPTARPEEDSSSLNEPRRHFSASSFQCAYVYVHIFFMLGRGKMVFL